MKSRLLIFVKATSCENKEDIENSWICSKHVVHLSNAVLSRINDMKDFPLVILKSIK